MIEIIDSQILRDGVNIGVIEGKTAYVTEKQAPRIVGQIRAAAGNHALVVEVGAPTVKESLTVDEPAEIGVTVEVPDVVVNETAQSEKQPTLTVASGKQTFDTTGFPDHVAFPAKFRICFVNHYGNDAYNAWQESNA